MTDGVLRIEEILEILEVGAVDKLRRSSGLTPGSDLVVWSVLPAASCTVILPIYVAWMFSRHLDVALQQGPFWGPHFGTGLSFW